ncbi:hypothetical protein DFQ10_104240 [Winogradskyella eximia]|jgi:predicted lactoylglutathione lyase|uniref:Glyoxalase/bleomycin resistance protein/dioxygenase superfamily protein n=1 Tax=Winogradskyella eximia TaxID=262006 RepID=A0A3D9H3G7_9FLAO|nr:hypothetical protein [Winogradskyella eximia]RED44047.1 hypothetical protein DFQ10_104240 [Winogradskyella eximia]
MKLRSFSISLAVKDIKTSQTFYDTLGFEEDQIGAGNFIYMVSNTLFRSFWKNGKLFLVNAVFFVNNNAYEL